MRGSVGHQRLDELGQIHVADDDPSEDVALGQHAPQRPVGIADEHRIAGAGALYGAHAIGQTRPGWDGHRLAAAEHAEALIGQGRDATSDRALGEVGHVQSVVRPARHAVVGHGAGRGRQTWRRPRLIASAAMDRRTATGIALFVVSAAGYATGERAGGD